jgi:hypothetical protein
MICKPFQYYGDNMPKKIDDDNPSESTFEIKLTQKSFSQKDTSLGFLLVAVGLVAYIFYTAKIVTFTWLHTVSIALVIIGFVLLIIETLGKIRFH